MRYSWKNRIRQAVKAVASVAEILPNRGDGPFKKAAKLVQAWEASEEYMFPPKGDILEDLRDYGARSSIRGSVGQLLFDFAVGRGVPMEPLGLVTGAKAFRVQLGRFSIFQLSRDSGKHGGSKVDFASDAESEDHLIGDFWDYCGTSVRFWEDDRSFGKGSSGLTPFEPQETQLIGSLRTRLDQFVGNARRYIRDGISQTHVLVGPPGTGKTTFAKQVPFQLGLPVMLMNARSLCSLRTAELLRTIRPGVLLIDDADHADLGSRDQFLDTLEEMREAVPGLLTIITANVIEAIPPAARRPGRIDERHVFDPPDTPDRQVLLEGFLGDRASDEGVVSRLLGASEGLTSAYLKKLALKYSYEGLSAALEEAIAMRASAYWLGGVNPSASSATRCAFSVQLDPWARLPAVSGGELQGGRRRVDLL